MALLRCCGQPYSLWSGVTHMGELTRASLASTLQKRFGVAGAAASHADD